MKVEIKLIIDEISKITIVFGLNENVWRIADSNCSREGYLSLFKMNLN